MAGSHPIERDEFRDAVTLLRDDVRGLSHRLDQHVEALRGEVGQIRTATTETQVNLRSLAARVAHVETHNASAHQWWHKVTSGAVGAAVAFAIKRFFA